MHTVAPAISVVLSFYNEAESLPPLADELALVLGSVGKPYEVVLVDDASTDRSVDVAGSIVAGQPGFRLVRHRVNCGQSAGQATGFAAALAPIVVTLDADGQNDPADLPGLLDALTDGVDCVVGVRQKRRDRWIKRVASKIANRFRNAMLGEAVSDAGCAYRVIRRSCLAEVPVFNGMHRFLPTILRLQGFVVTEVPVGHRARAAGVSKYGVNDRLWRGLRDCMAMRWYRRRVILGRRALTDEDQPVAKETAETTAMECETSAT